MIKRISMLPLFQRLKDHRLLTKQILTLIESSFFIVIIILTMEIKLIADKSFLFKLHF